MNPVKRAWLFARDYISEFGCVWAIARNNDCERNGGHQWRYDSVPPAGMIAFGDRTATCKRCGSTQTFPATTATNGNAVNYRLYTTGL
jgi:hypothetical protein